MKFWEFKNKTEKVGDLYIYGEITNEKWFDDDVTPNNFKRDLDALGNIDTLNIYINSVGGDVFSAQTMVSILERNKAKKHVYIDGLAASAATFPLMIADKVTIADKAMIMIHNAWSFVAGNANELLKMADILQKIDGNITKGYAKLSGKTEEEIQEMMNAETWMTADEAFKNGFAHEISESMKIAAKVTDETLILNGIELKIDQFENKDQLLETYRGLEEPEPVVDSTSTALEPDLSEQRKQFFDLKVKIFGGK